MALLCLFPPWSVEQTFVGRNAWRALERLRGRLSRLGVGLITTLYYGNRKVVAYTTYFELGNWYFIGLTGLTTQHDTEKRRESFLIWSIFDRNFTFKWVIVSIFNLILCFFLDSSRSESIRVDPSWSELMRPGLAVRVDPVRLLYLPYENRHFEAVGGSPF